MTSYKVEKIDGSLFQNKYHVNHLLAKVFAKANFSDQEIKEILDQDDRLTTSQADCVKQASRRILEAKEKNEKVFIGGDYDSDGICSTAIMKDILDRLRIVNGYYIPDRHKEGYGLSKETVIKAHEKGYQLIITVDNGVKAFEAITTAKELGMDIIITDHHQIDEVIPADIVVHPDYMEERYRYLSGAGVALEISRTLLGEIESHTALASIALIADVMPLWQETRKIVRKGIKYLRQGALPSVLSLFRGNTVIDEISIAFQVVPKLNSVARLEDDSNVNTIVPFLLSHHAPTISTYSQQLNRVNEKRRSLSSTMCTRAESMIQEEGLIVLYDESFQEGLAGLVAGRIAASHHKPCLVLAKNETLLKGSGRSIPGFNLFEFLKEEYHDYISFGGHEQAVGLSVSMDQFESFKHDIVKAYNQKCISCEMSEKAILLDEKDLSVEAIESLEMLKPLPKQLQHLLFAIERPQVEKILHYEKVTKYELLEKDAKLSAVVFASQKLPSCETPSLIVGTLSINAFRGMKSVQMLVEYMEN